MADGGVKRVLGVFHAKSVLFGLSAANAKAPEQCAIDFRRSSNSLDQSNRKPCIHCWQRQVTSSTRKAVWNLLSALVALDGTDSFSSEKISCPCCTRQTLKNGKTLYRHTVVTPVIVAPGQSSVIPLPHEFVSAQDGQEKQDCELAAESGG